MTTEKYSKLEQKFIDIWVKRHPTIILQNEYRFHSSRRWRFDFAHIESNTAIEINGGIWNKGGHSSGNGLLRDYEKLNEAVFLGWSVFQLARSQITANWIDRLAIHISSISHG